MNNRKIRKNFRKVNNLKTSKLKTILFNKCVNKAQFAITNFAKFNEQCIKILEQLQKVLVLERSNDKNHTIAAI